MVRDTSFDISEIVPLHLVAVRRTSCAASGVRSGRNLVSAVDLSRRERSGFIRSLCQASAAWASSAANLLRAVAASTRAAILSRSIFGWNGDKKPISPGVRRTWGPTLSPARISHLCDIPFDVAIILCHHDRSGSDSGAVADILKRMKDGRDVPEGTVELLIKWPSPGPLAAAMRKGLRVTDGDWDRWSALHLEDASEAEAFLHACERTPGLCDTPAYSVALAIMVHGT